MEVAFITPSASRAAGGIFEIARNLASELSRKNVNVRVLSHEDEFSSLDAAQWGAVPVDSFPVRGFRGFGYSPQLYSSLLDGGFDICHLHALWMHSSVAVRNWHRRSGRPYVITINGMLEPWALKNSRYKKWIASILYERMSLSRAACLHANTEKEAADIRTFGLVNPICIVPNGVELPKSVRGTPPAWASRLPVGARVFLYLGRIHPKKGLEHLVRGFSAALKNGALRDDWYLVVAGWDQAGHEGELSALSSEVGVADRIRFVGPQFGNAKQDSLERAAAVVLPSLSEGLPMVVLEAWAHARPVLMTPHCNLTVGFEKNAALSMLPDTQEVARTLADFAGMADQEQEQMGLRGRKLVLEQYDWESVANEILSLYRWISGGGPRPSTILS